MNHAHETMLPRGALALAAAMVLGALTVTTAARVFGLPPSASPVLLREAGHVAPIETRDLTFTDRPDGSVMIGDADVGGAAGVIAPGSNSGFIRGVMRGMARERHKWGLGASQPFRLTLWRDGELSLADQATGRVIELTAFGATNRAAFASLLRDGGRAR